MQVPSAPTASRVTSRARSSRSTMRTGGTEHGTRRAARHFTSHSSFNQNQSLEDLR
nr:MAG TPA: hypothetical protein [Caudoviricetes sp.]